MLPRKCRMAKHTRDPPMSQYYLDSTGDAANADVFVLAAEALALKVSPSLAFSSSVSLSRRTRRTSAASIGRKHLGDSSTRGGRLVQNESDPDARRTELENPGAR